jgi:predicted transcriptional regulator
MKSLREFRRGFGIRQRELAGPLGVSQSLLSLLELGHLRTTSDREREIRLLLVRLVQERVRAGQRFLSRYAQSLPRTHARSTK